MKLAPVARALLRRHGIEHTIVHTGQHYDREMSEAFFTQLEIPTPDHNLEVGSSSHAQQTATIMQRLEPVLLSENPDVLLVYGDVNSTMAAAIVAAKLGIHVGHVEAGLRSRDWTMPEEINRIITDRLSRVLFTPSRDADDNLRHEGVSGNRIYFVGNVMIDSLVHALPKARELNAPARFGVEAHHYALVTLHRPSNVDDDNTLAELLTALSELAADGPVLFPMHPRTRQRLEGSGFKTPNDLHLLEPVPYLEMVGLVASASLVITDSGGLQEETTFLGIPCLTVRSNTERPVTCAIGTNRLVRPLRADLLAAARNHMPSPLHPPMIERWDGQASERIAQVLCDGATFES